MKTIKKTDRYIILQRRDGRYAVKSTKGHYINADEKLVILTENNLVKKPEPKAPEVTEEKAEETPIEETVVEEAPAEEASVEAEQEQTQEEKTK